MLRKLFVIVGVALCLSFSIHAQPDIVLQVGVPEFYQRILPDDLFDAFEDSHPGVTVQLNSNGFETPVMSPVFSVQDHLSGVRRVMQSADVLLIDGAIVTPEATRTGYILDLSPLLDDEPTQDAFYPALLNAYQWDSGTWALPAGSTLQMLVYDRTAFDEAGLTYPNADWSFADFANATVLLSDETRTGFEGALAPLLRCETGMDFTDNTGMPDFDAINESVTIWQATRRQIEETIQPDGSGEAPMRIGSVVDEIADGETELAMALLPGGCAGFDVDGLAVSGGTLYPELAYALAQYLTADPNIVFQFGANTIPSRPALLDNPDDPFSGMYTERLTPEVITIIDTALENALTPADIRFGEYANSLFASANAITSASTEALARENVNIAESRRDETITVVAPHPIPVLETGDISIHFGLNLATNTLPDPNVWESLVESFVADDPVVGSIELDTMFFGPIQPGEVDCFYVPYSFDPGTFRDVLLPMQPLVDADPDFDPANYATGTLAQTTFQDTIYGLPIVIQPVDLFYDADMFEQNGIPLPDYNWAINDFLFAVEALPESPVVSMMGYQNNDYIEMFTAALGGLLFDYRVSPPAVNFTDPATISALQQVLELIRNGKITFDNQFDVAAYPIGNTLFGASPGYSAGPPTTERAYRAVSFPQSDRIAPITYNVGAAFITAQATDPNACYRWIQTVAQRPDLFGGVPAQLDQINDSSATAFANLLDDPRAVVFPYPANLSGGSDIVRLIEYIWLTRVYDAYLNDDVELEVALTQSEAHITEFRSCVANISTTEDLSAFNETAVTCAIATDPALQEIFGN